MILRQNLKSFLSMFILVFSKIWIEDMQIESDNSLTFGDKSNILDGSYFLVFSDNIIFSEQTSLEEELRDNANARETLLKEKDDLEAELQIFRERADFSRTDTQQSVSCRISHQHTSRLTPTKACTHSFRLSK